jgi:hypothetical protein
LFPSLTDQDALKGRGKEERDRVSHGQPHDGVYKPAKVLC